MRQSAYEDLVRSLYRAAAGLIGFDSFLARANQHFRSDYSAFMAAHRYSSRTKIIGIDGMSEDEVAVYNDVFAKRNPMLKSALPGLMAGKVVRSSTCISDAALRKSSFFADWMNPADLYYSIGFTALSDEDWIHNFVLARSPRRGDYEASDDRYLEQLAKHFRTAIEVHRRFDEIQSHCEVTGDALEHLQSGVIFLKSDGEVVQANRTARRLLDERKLLAMQDNRLFTGTMRSQELSQLVGAIRRNRISHGIRVVLNEHPTGQRCCLTVYRVGDSRQFFGMGEQSVAFILFISTSDGPTQSALQNLAVEFGLTPRELDLVMALWDGSPLSSAAQQLGVSEETARSHRRHVYQKLNVHSRAELHLMLQQVLACD